MKNNTSFILILAAIAVVSRLIPHVANFAPVLAIIVFIGYLSSSWKKAVLSALAIGILSDAALHVNYLLGGSEWEGFYLGAEFTYVSYAIAAIIGATLNSSSILKNTAFTLLGAIAFFIITNLGVWLYSGMYALSFNGLIECYTMALPFFRTTALVNVIGALVVFSAANFYTIKKIETV